MKIITRVIILLIFSAFIFYIALPIPPYPENPPNSPLSDERGDTEDFKNRRAYFTDLSRDEVLAFHTSQLNSTSLNLVGRTINIPLPTYRLNYPPEEAYTFIKDQTRSWYLEEIVHPFRESFFVNGFIPQVAKDAIIINDREFKEKISMRYYRSNIFVRITLAAVSFALLLLLLNEWRKTLFTKNG
ncbi:hypothetical protein HY404_00715 [Candidatus Microgenomates bacterium]|nr:hypothetical protein [Candidatus Microgenomates bacterium]